MGRWGLALGPEVLKQIHERMVRIAHDKGVTAGRRMLVDTTVVETNIHHPTDSTLLRDGVRVLTRRRADARPAGGCGGFASICPLGTAQLVFPNILGAAKKGCG
jgi:transposase, IS5 family